ncbi:translin-associated protein X-like isoform X1 [Haliotis rubra]|uniref:translin-associated protein X-like isoform X1 n=2 Tax=Haliotis rubra TaxID=36100 RepID=UPI001EE567ED|nr:translin-associated protein X-like isoform X1 [Haliotis rubra]
MGEIDIDTEVILKGGKQMRKRKNTDVDENSTVIKAFREFQVLLDTRHDKYERLVKLSRDVTIESKRTIFMLHRVAGNEDSESLLAQTLEKLNNIKLIKMMKISEELEGEDPYQFLRAYSPGLQEFIEAVTFYHYLHSGSLVTLQQIQDDLTFPTPHPAVENVADITAPNVKREVTVQVLIPPLEYMLGVADLTGELMRLTINSVGAGDLQLPFKVCAFMRRIHDAFLSYGNVSRELNRKMSTLRQSLHKVENACYTIQVRGSEIPKHLIADVLSGTSECSSRFQEEPCDE